MTQIFRVALFAVLCLVNCRSDNIMQQGCVLARRATISFVLSLVPGTFSSAEYAFDDADDEGGDSLEENMEGDGAEGGPDVADVFKDMDKDGDGFLNITEILPDEREIPQNVKAFMTKAFGIADLDLDGKLSFDEFPTAMKIFDQIMEQEDSEENAKKEL
mmetsp:Transcript_123791/g.240951  ORF Transcript_123791/g.240951 Transcript_123791/m.240951 type:complete len:160 (+) Transcript_123791:50-529(+)